MIRIITLIGILATTLLAQDNPRGEFYIKEDVKGFLSFKEDYQRFSQQAISGINHSVFKENWGYSTIDFDSAGAPVDTFFVSDTNRLYQYSQFGPDILGMGFEIGAQYHQISSWLDIFFMPTQVSPVPSSIANPVGLWDIKWYRYGFDWMFGYMIAPPNSFVNVIPSAGFGFNLLNIHYASSYDLSWKSPPDPLMSLYSLGDRYYSTFGRDVTAQIEVRFNLGIGISLGGYAGTRMTWYDRITLESGGQEYIMNHDEMSGNAWFIGGKVTYTMQSISEKREKEKL